MSLMDESCFNDSLIRDISWMSHVSYEWMSHVSCQWVISHMNVCVTLVYSYVMFVMNESCLLRMRHISYEWVISHMNIYVTLVYSCVMFLMNESCLLWMSHNSHGYMCDIGVFMCDVSLTHESCLSWMRHIPCEYMCDIGVFKCDVTHSYATWLIRRRHDSFIHISHPILMRHSYVWHDSFTRVSEWHVWHAITDNVHITRDTCDR